ncbi:MAG: Flp pilus assembly protein CpaB [Alphaproteobacteria bacterium]
MRFGGLIAAIVIAALAALLVLRYTTSHEQAAPQQSVASTPPPVKTVSIYVASQNIPIGVTLTQEMVTAQPWPENLLVDGFIRSDTNTNIVGMVTRAPFQAQEPFMSGSLAKPGDPNFLAGNLPKGMRVITLQTNEIEGLAGFVFPGDHIDVLLTHPIMKWINPPAVPGAAAVAPHQETDSVTETLLSNALVLAVDQHATSTGTTDKNGNLVVPRSVSLMVTPADAQKIRLGAQKGTLTLSLRSLQDKESVDQPLLTTTSDITQYQQGDTDANDSGVMVVRGITGLQSSSVAESANRPGTSPVRTVTPVATAAAPPPVAAPGALVRPSVAQPSATSAAPPPVAAPSPLLPAAGAP